MKLVFKVTRVQCGGTWWTWGSYEGDRVFGGPCAVYATRLEAVEDIGRFILAVDAAKIEIED